MIGKARRDLSRICSPSARRARRMMCLWLALGVAVAPGGSAAADITAARYSEPTTRYAHGILGDAVEWGALVLTLKGGAQVTLRLPDTMVFEDSAPRLADLNGDNAPEVIAVESSLTQGARLAVFDRNGRIAATPFIGRPHRWLAPVGAGDLDGDGSVEIAFVDRPHLARTLRVWRFETPATGKPVLRELASATGLTNHRIGWPDIPGGIRDCAHGLEIITADANWRAVMASRFDGTTITTRRIAPYKTKADLARAMTCP